MSVSPKLRIGLNVGFIKDSQGEGFSCLSERYHDAITAAGGLPVLLPPLDDNADIEQFLDGVDGFVLVGGADLDCRNDGFHLHDSMNIQDGRREEADRRLVRLIAAKQMPVLGIGSGMQILNVCFGGTLFLHLPADRPRAVSHVGRDPVCKHAIMIVADDSLVSRAYGPCQPIVNSQHHQAVDDVADGFYVTARCPDKTVEAIESTNPDWLAVGVQFHPEQATTRLDAGVFGEFLKGVKRFMEIQALEAA